MLKQIEAKGRLEELGLASVLKAARSIQRQNDGHIDKVVQKHKFRRFSIISEPFCFAYKHCYIYYRGILWTRKRLKNVLKR